MAGEDRGPGSHDTPGLTPATMFAIIAGCGLLLLTLVAMQTLRAGAGLVSGFLGLSALGMVIVGLLGIRSARGDLDDRR
jgi:low temperature requirement protein LtrA